MSGKTITRADLCEAVYQKVGLSRTESSALVELVLKEITDCLERVEYLSGEFHINRHLEAQGYSTERLIAKCREFIPAKKLKISSAISAAP